jgi:hypothetical protein
VLFRVQIALPEAHFNHVANPHVSKHEVCVMKLLSYGFLKHRLTQLLCMLLISVPLSSFGGKPTDDDGIYLGNGFPSGPHFNLIIHGKKLSFQCPDPEYYYRVLTDVNGDGDEGELVESCDDGDVCELTDVQNFGNSVFTPRDGRNVQMLFESGRKGPKSKPDATSLEVTDWCTKPFDVMRLQYGFLRTRMATPSMHVQPGNPPMAVSQFLAAVWHWLKPKKTASLLTFSSWAS